MTSTRNASTPAGLSKPDATIQPGTQVLFVVLIVLAGSGLALWALPPGTSLYVIAPLQVLLGSAVFIALILLVVLAFARLGLYDRGSALALPDGSVRALIALILLIIFIIFANVIFGQLSERTSTQVASFSGLTQQQVDELPGAVQTKVLRPATDTEPASYAGTYVISEPSQDAAAVGQQVVTGLLTLVAAISAFYFGSGSVTAGASAMRQSRTTGPGDLRVLRPSQPVALQAGDAGGFLPLDIELGGSAVDAGGVTAAVVSNDPEGRLARGVADNQFTYTAGAAAVDPVTLRFTSNADAGATIDLVVNVRASEQAVVETPAAPPPTGGPAAPVTPSTPVAAATPPVPVAAPPADAVGEPVASDEALPPAGQDDAPDQDK